MANEKPNDPMGLERVVVAGAGPAGLSAAYEMVRRELHPIILEKVDQVV